MRIRTEPPRPGHVTEQLISALAPDSTARRPAPPPVSLAALPAASPTGVDDPGAVLLGTARVDRSGRVHERALLRALGWGPGQSVELDVCQGMIVMAGAADGVQRIDDRGAIVLPAAARRMCRIPTGPPVVLVAVVPRQLLLVHPARTVARLLAAHHAALLGTGDVR